MGVLLGALPTASDADRRAVSIAAVGAVLLSTSVAIGARVAAFRTLLRDASRPLDDPDVVASAQAFGEVWGVVLTPWVAAWIMLSLWVAGVAVWRAPLPRALRPRWAVELVVLVVLGLGPALATASYTRSAADRIAPGWLAAAIATEVPALHLREAGGLVAIDGCGSPLEVGDQLVAVQGRTVDTLAELYVLLRDCRCPAMCDPLDSCLGVHPIVSVTRGDTLLPLEI